MIEINQFPNELLLKIFFYIPQSVINILIISETCKLWQQLSDELWKKQIRPEYQTQLQQSELSAKEFCQHNPDARLDTYYVVGEPIDVAYISFLGEYKKKKLQANDLLASFDNQLTILENKKIPLFASINEAIEYTLTFLKNPNINTVKYLTPDPGYWRIFKYPIIFSLRLNPNSELTISEQTIEKLFFLNHHDPLHRFPAFEAKPEDITKIIDGHYVIGSLNGEISNRLMYTTNLNVSLKPNIDNANDNQEQENLNHCAIS